MFITRRKFLQTCAAGVAAVASNANAFANWKTFPILDHRLGRVKLGKTGLTVSRLAMGTGTNGWRQQSNQTRLGMKNFVGMAEYAYGSGLTFFDAADTYGSHAYLREALKTIPREKIVILTKIWVQSRGWPGSQQATEILDRFRKEINTDYLDIVLLHCQTSPDWLAETQRLRESLSQAKSQGVVRALGVSCHSFEALQAAAASDWVDVLLARINHTGSAMDGKPERVMPVLKQAHDRGAGVIGMKIFGAGALTQASQRQQALHYVLQSGNVDAMTIGFENIAHVSDAVNRVNGILQS